MSNKYTYRFTPVGHDTKTFYEHIRTKSLPGLPAARVVATEMIADSDGQYAEVIIQKVTIVDIIQAPFKLEK